MTISETYKESLEDFEFMSVEETSRPQPSGTGRSKKKRLNHNELERKRRLHQRNVLYELRDVIPSLQLVKPSTVLIMQKARDYIELLRNTIIGMENEIAQLRTLLMNSGYHLPPPPMLNPGGMASYAAANAVSVASVMGNSNGGGGRSSSSGDYNSLQPLQQGATHRLEQPPAILPLGTVPHLTNPSTPLNIGSTLMSATQSSPLDEASFSGHQDITQATNPFASAECVPPSYQTGTSTNSCGDFSTDCTADSLDQAVYSMSSPPASLSAQLQQFGTSQGNVTALLAGPVDLVSGTAVDTQLGQHDIKLNIGHIGSTEPSSTVGNYR